MYEEGHCIVNAEQNEAYTIEKKLAKGKGTYGVIYLVTNSTNKRYNTDFSWPSLKRGYRKSAELNFLSKSIKILYDDQN